MKPRRTNLGRDFGILLALFAVTLLVIDALQGSPRAEQAWIALEHAAKSEL